MGSKRKSLADELAELYNPAPAGEHDPDALDLGDGAKLASDDEFEHARQLPSKRAPEKAMLMRGDIDLEDAAYRGRKTSRAAVFGDEAAEPGSTSGDSEDEDLDSGDDLEEQEQREGHEDDEDDEEDDQEGALAGPSGRGTGKGSRPLGKLQADSQLANGHRDSVDASDGEDEQAEGEDDEEEDGLDLDLPTGSESDLDEDDEGGSGRGRDIGRDVAGKGRPASDPGAASGKRRRAAGGNELDELEAEYEALQEEDERQLAALRQKSERDAVKGVAVRNQQVLYERTLEQRILLHKCLQASNGLPRPDTHAALVQTQPDVRQGFAQLAAAARSTLEQLLELQRTLMARTNGITLPPDTSTSAGASAAPSARATKRSREADEEDVEDEGGADTEQLWRRISSHHEALGPYRDASLDSWHRRTVLSSGSGALRNGGLRALNQSISSQVNALMRDPAKFIKRTRLTLSACPRVLCEPRRAGAAAGPEARGGAAHTDGSGAAAHEAIPSSVAADVLEEERDPETYDDSEFYQQLLKEFLDKGLSQGPAAGAPKAAKKRKLVDRRASKGRKLRYHVQEKLVAFMAPVDFEPPAFAANLFSNLFGHAGK